MGGPILVFVPTEFERRAIEGTGLPSAVFVTLGFGVVAAGLRTVEEIQRTSPRAVILAGIAGSFDADAAPIGSAREFGAVAIDGLGAGEGEGYLGLRALRFPQIAATAGDDAVIDELALGGNGGLLLTVTAASAGEDQVRRRRSRWPLAVAEDMEGFSVALAARRAGIPCRILRGISNVAGEREHSRWESGAALRAARELLASILESGT